KILAICLIQWIGDKLRSVIPLSQAAYTKGRSDTEHVFALRTLAEKAITSSEYKLTLLMLDMSSAFDTVNRKKLIEIISQNLEPEELNLIKILIEQVELKVRIAKELGDPIISNIGVPQGDCLSPILFTAYLAYILQTYEQQQHQTYNFTLSLQYADDISWISASQEYVNEIKKGLPPQLRDYNLTVNASKTEDYTIQRKGNEDWRNCKFLGSKLGSREDIRNRKHLSLAAFSKISGIL
ncbi:uncharacterized protein LOC117113956, partial [Anneissia japonica]|uniref:uncharacterized protein LOC117113956 n=1 Tax=Anneissia japonica TaxID=1529436 RepID=UPI0014255259